MNIELSPDQIETLVRACDCAAAAMEDKLLDENYMLDFIESDQQKMEDFRANCRDLQMRLDVLLMTNS
jgi:hypothetical protein